MTPPLVRRTGLLARGVQQRDARLFVVATEDRYAGRQYFAALEANGVIPRHRVKVHVLPTEDSHSSASAVLARLKELDTQYRPMDERWLSLDVDHQASGSHLKALARVCKEAEEDGIQLAISNPCFEAWLLLHFSETRPPSTPASCEQALRDVTGSYNKTRLQGERYTAQRVRGACRAARTLDMSPKERWPNQPGSHVYRLVERLLEA